MASLGGVYQLKEKLSIFFSCRMLPNCRELKLADTSTKLMIIGRPTDDYWVTAQWTIVEAVTELFLHY